jgi:hypothetical protein
MPYFETFVVDTLIIYPRTHRIDRRWNSVIRIDWHASLSSDPLATPCMTLVSFNGKITEQLESSPPDRVVLYKLRGTAWSAFKDGFGDCLRLELHGYPVP